MKKSLLGAAITLLAAAQLPAAVVFSVSSAGQLAMPSTNYFGPGPIAYSDYVWSSTNASNQGGSVFGYTGGYGYDANGQWNGALGPMAGLNDSFDVYGDQNTMTFAFRAPRMEVGGFINYVPGGSTDTTIAVYDAGMNLLESYNLTFLTGGGTNTGMTIGFLRSTADISYFTLTGNYIGIAGSAIPEPSSLVLMGSALAAAVAYAKRRAAR